MNKTAPLFVHRPMRRLLTIFSALALCWIGCAGLLAQEAWRGAEPPSSAPVGKTSPQKTADGHEREPRTLPLPFFDNFLPSRSGPLDAAQHLPDTNRWFSNSGVQVNRSGAVNSPDFGTLIFDGAAADGRGWFLSPIAVTEGADTLTSHYFDLTGRSPEDSLRFSFWYQGGGRMERPDSTDSLFLEFRDTSGSFQKVWRTSSVDTAKFLYAAVWVEDSAFFHRNFQFRLRNVATRNGPFDQWFVDHVWFADKRSQNDTLPADRSVAAIERGLLWPYTALPRRVLNGLVYNSEISVRLRSANSQRDSTRLHVMLSDPAGGVGLIDVRRTQTGLPPLADTTLAIYFDDSTRWTYAGNSTIRHTAYLDSSARDFIRSNDTLRVDYRADTLFALDDGEAESWYGVTNPNAPFAQRYFCAGAERLQAVWLAFTPRETLYDTALTFNLGVWSYRVDTIRKTGFFLRDSIFLDTVITPIYLSPIEDTVRYGPAPNTFYRYAFDPQAVTDGLTEVQGDFLVGMIQKQAIPIGVGYDRNANNSGRIVFQVRPQVWSATAGDGTLMVRPEVTNAYPRKQPPSAGGKTAAELTVFPNPLQGSFLTLRAEGTEELLSPRWRLLDLTGRTLASGGADRWAMPYTLELTRPQAGAYLLRIEATTETHETRSWTTRLILLD